MNKVVLLLGVLISTVGVAHSDQSVQLGDLKGRYALDC